MATKQKNKTTKNIASTLAVLALAVFGFIFSADQSLAACPSTGTANCGVFTSQVKDIGYKVPFENLNWTETKPADTYLVMEFQAGNPTTSGTACSAGVTWSATWAAVANGGSLAAFNNNQCVQYRATLSSNNISIVPSLDDITISYYAGELVSSFYNTRNYGNKMSSISWNEGTLPQYTDVLFQVRTGTFDGTAYTWTNWMGPNGTSASYFTDPAGGEAMPAALTAGDNDQWVQYKMILIRNYMNASTTPIVSDVSPGFDFALLSGTFTSQIKDATRSVAWTTLSWTATTPANTSITMRARAGNTATPDGTWTAWTGVTNGGSLSTMNGNRYLQYEATLSTTDTNNAPTLDEAVASYSYYEDNKTLISSPYNTNSSGNVIAQLSWKQDAALPTNTALKFQLQSSSDNITWSGWVGPDGTSASYFYYTSAGDKDSNCADGGLQDGGATRLINCAIPAGHILKIGDNDQWMQYKVFFRTSEGGAPALYDATITYVANAPPCVGTTAIGPPVSCTPAAISVGQAENTGVISIPSYPISDAEEAAEDGKVNVQFFYDTGVTTTGAGNTGNITVSSSASLDFPVSGYVMIDNEVIQYTSITDGGGANNDTLAVAGRGGAYPVSWPETGYTTQASAHSAGSTVWVLAASAAGKGEKTGITATSQNFSATLYPATDIKSNGTFDYGSAKIRIALNDGNGSSQIGTVNSSGTFVLDLKKPAYGSPVMKIDSLAAGDKLTAITVTEISTLSVRYTNASNINGSTCAADLAAAYPTTPYGYEPLVGNSKTWTLAPDANGISVCFQAKDNYGNEQSITFTATPQKPVNTRINDISIPPASKYKLLIWWDVVPDPGNFSKYNVYRCDRAAADPAAKCDSLANYSLLTIITDRTINYCIDEGDGDCTDNANGLLNSTTTYYYKITAEDIDGISPYSTAASGLLTYPNVAGTPNGSTVGEADTTAPVISFASSGSNPAVTDTAASLTYSATDNISPTVFLSVVYEPANTPPASYTKESANPSIITAGENGIVTLAGLASNTKYYYKIKARDNSGNTAELGPYFFTTTIDSVAPAAITDLSAPAANLAATSLTLTWTAPGDNEDIGTASSYDIRYSTVSASDIATNWASATQVTNEPLPMAAGSPQSMVISGLTPSTTYYFAIKTKDEIPNTSLISNVATVTTPAQADLEIPSITAVSSGTSTATSVTVTWTTANKASSSLVDFGATTSYGFTQGNSSELTTSHSVTLVGLTPSTSYKFRVKSISGSGNTGADDNSGAGYPFTTASSSAGTLPEITSVSASSVTATSAVISWTTSGPGAQSDSIVGYNVDPGNTYTLEAGNSASVESHSVTLTSLSPFTKYYYRVKSRNGDQLAIASSDINGDFNFTTLAGADTIPPTISSVQVTTITSNKATITWTTSENADSYVDFGTSAGVYSSTQGNANDSTVSHSVIITSLTPETTYYFRVRSADAAGNSASSVGTPFATTSGAAVDCPTRAGASCQTCQTCPASDITAPVISGIKVADIGFNSAAVTWGTDEDSNSVVNYDTTSFGVKQSYGYSAGKVKDLVKSHSVILTNLDSASTYYFQIYSSDAKGNIAESDTQSFKTIAIIETKDKGKAVAADLKKEFESIAQTLVKDNLATEQNIKDIIARISNPPVIGSEGPIVKDIKNYGATIVWKTDRKANAVVKFRPATSGSSTTLGVNDNWREMGKMDSFDLLHEVPLLGLAPSTSYSFFVQSQDILGGVAKSETQSFTTASLSSIFNVAITDLNLTQATINWETSNLSTSSLEWGLSPSYGNYKDKGAEKVQKHSILLDNLSSGAAYHYRVRSIEETGTILSSDDYAFTTPNLPQITKYTLGEIKDTSVALSWTSNIPIDSNIRYTDTATGETKIQGKEEKIIDHSLTLSNLESGKSYKIEIQGRDDKGNLAEIPAFEVQTGMDNVPPELAQVRSQSAILGGAEDKVQAIISWRTNELADTKVLWDLGSTKGDKFANETKLDSNLTTNHIAVTTSFKPGTVYRFRVVSSDKFGNISTSPDYTVLTPIRRQSVIQMIVNQFEGVFGWMTRLGR